jgi:hypothetical protein
MTSLKSAELKLARANQHIDNLDAELRTYAESGVYEIGIDSDRDPVNDFVKFTVTKGLAPIINLLIGDAVHNLRSAVDHAWDEIGGKTVKGNKKEFPASFPTPDLLEAFFDKRPDEPFLQKIRNTVVNVIQPYKTGNGAFLFPLHKLDIQDKHRLLIPHIHRITLDHVFVEDSEGRKHGIIRREFTARRNFFIGGSLGKLKLIDKGRVAFGIVFREEFLPPNSDVVPTLREFAIGVRRVLETLEPFA